MKTEWNTSGARTSRSDSINILVSKPEVTLDFCFSRETGDAPDENSAPVIQEFGARLDAVASGIDREGTDFFTIQFGGGPRRR